MSLHTVTDLQCSTTICSVDAAADSPASQETSRFPRVDRLVQRTWGLLTGATPNPLHPCDQEWHLNLGLLMPVYERTGNQDLRRKVAFLAIQYLARASHINLSDQSATSIIDREHASLYQLGIFQDSATYHRSSSVFERYVAEAMETQFVPSSSNYFLLTDTADFGEMLPLYFPVAEIRDSEGCSRQIAAQVKRHDALHDGSFRHFMEPPILVDLTPLLAASITSDETEYVKQIGQIEKMLEEAIAAALEGELKELEVSPEKLRAFIHANLLAVCRCSVKGVGVLKLIPLFESAVYPSTVTEDDTLCGARQAGIIGVQADFLIHFLNMTGLRLGAVRARERVFQFIDLPKFLEVTAHVNGPSHRKVVYAPSGPNALYIKNKKDLLETRLFRSFAQVANYPSADRALLAKAATAILSELFTTLSDETWEALNADPDTREVLQTTLVRLAHHLTQATLSVDDFAHFTTSLELVYSEIASILALTTPFAPDAFAGIYIPKLTHIPRALRASVRAGVAKSAMNAFAGSLALAAQAAQKERAQAVMMPGVYHEQMPLVGEHNTLEAVLGDERIETVDVFVGEFNPNINKSMTHTVYFARDPIRDVEELLRTKPKTHRLTVVLDSTIDFVRSERAGGFFTRFSEAIQAGKLNVIVLRSGQKFDMLGMDNYYGSPFYMVNNGEAYWEPFNALVESEAYQTDPLTMQWFCLANQAAFKQMEAYRALIFKQARTLLDHVPANLMPGQNPHVHVSLAEEGVDPCFIELKIVGELKWFHHIKRIFFEGFQERKRKAYSKPGFGFLSPNLLPYTTSEGEPRIIRINPGLDPEDTSLILELLNHLSEII